MCFIFFSTKSKLTWMNAFKELFAGIKDQAWSRSFCSLFCIRRMYLWAILIFCQDYSVTLKLSICLSIQLPYFILIWYMRPFELAKDNITEILNEILFTGLLCSHYYLQVYSDWSSIFEYSYIWIIVANNIVSVIMSISKVDLWLFLCYSPILQISEKSKMYDILFNLLLIFVLCRTEKDKCQTKN